jgi:hypothetical protein
VRAEDLREFAARSRAEVSQKKLDYWRQAAQSGEGLAAFEAAQALYEHARSVSDFPDQSYREADFAHHLRLKDMIDRASRVAPFARAAR